MPDLIEHLPDTETAPAGKARAVIGSFMRKH
jgi:hypothetical protein